MSDSPCKSPDCPADCDLISWDVIGSSSKLNPLRGARFLGDCTVFALAVFLGRATARETDFFRLICFAAFFLEVVFFAGRFFTTAFRAGLPFLTEVRLSLAVFFLGPLLAAITAVYHRPNQGLKTLCMRFISKTSARSRKRSDPGGGYAKGLSRTATSFFFILSYTLWRTVEHPL